MEVELFWQADRTIFLKRVSLFRAHPCFEFATVTMILLEPDDAALVGRIATGGYGTERPFDIPTGPSSIDATVDAMVDADQTDGAMAAIRFLTEPAARTGKMIPTVHFVTHGAPWLLK